jgi:hypothetical protein
VEPQVPEFVTGRVLARYPGGKVEEIDLGPAEWRPMNLHPNGRQIERIELSEELDEMGERRALVVFTGPRF